MNRLDYWMEPATEEGFLRVVSMPCPLTLSFDNDTHLFDSSCPVFDLGVDSGASFDSEHYLISSEWSTFDEWVDYVPPVGGSPEAILPATLPFVL